VLKTSDQFVFLSEGNVSPGKIISFNGENVYISTMASREATYS
jgi:hypothetical protein